MTRRLPLCAWCGGPLRVNGRGANTRLTWAWPGRPEVGWHMGHKDQPETSCFLLDPVFDRLMAQTEDRMTLAEYESILGEVGERGPGRVVSGSAWHRFLNRELWAKAACGDVTVEGAKAWS